MHGKYDFFRFVVKPLITNVVLMQEGPASARVRHPDCRCRDEVVSASLKRTKMPLEFQFLDVSCLRKRARRSTGTPSCTALGANSGA